MSEKGIDALHIYNILRGRRVKFNLLNSKILMDVVSVNLMHNDDGLTVEINLCRGGYRNCELSNCEMFNCETGKCTLAPIKELNSQIDKS